MPRCPRRAAGLLLALAALAGSSACSGDDDPVATRPVGAAGPAAGEPAPPAAARERGLPRLTARRSADVLVTSRAPLSAKAVQGLTALAPRGGSAVFRAGLVTIGARRVEAVGVDPAAFRAFAAKGTAEATAVWEAARRGEAVVAHGIASLAKLQLGGPFKIGPADGGVASRLRLGAVATTGVPGAEVVVDERTGAALGLAARTGVVLSAGKGVKPATLLRKARALAGPKAQVELVRSTTSAAADPTAYLAGARAAKAFGAFTYRAHPDGTIEPDAAWVRRSIATSSVPILGRVTCHRLMLPQLTGALSEVVRAGLADTLHTYDGCYVPRFIERNPSGSISLHTWGIAIDMDAATNYRGIAGTMHPEVVRIFKRWGFRWGGDWAYTDPMHFELAALLTSPR